ncbi:hypothetical protein [Streptomyces alboflavus]|uniref:hypothetical protein n=1 Tax=Streptomyces alboflavus TaxID=67267 RepID=UPI0004C17A35|nr:hypothetical protein [Streptomyces alboflavus]
MPDMSGSASLAVTHLVPLAKEVDENKVTPGVLGFIVFAVMALAVWRLMKSMNRHMGKVDFKEAPEGQVSATASPDEEPAGVGSPSGESKETRDY